ncbi:MAG: TrbI/VirB10 family protein [Alphaproteobacteria bacterium]|nr:TrbI/VirB10 family protein [Alphaproteobacteria bacterium]
MIDDDHAQDGEQEPEEHAPDQVAPMRLRGTPPHVTRLSRKVLMGLGAVALVGIGGTLVYALQSARTVTAPTELYNTNSRNTADGLQTLPHDYSGVPLLGRPLPGDLGRPILNSGSANHSLAPVATPNAADRQRQQEMDAARTAKLFAQAGTPSKPSSSAVKTVPSQPSTPNLASLGLAPPTTTAQNRQRAFLNASVDRNTVSADRVQPPASPNILQAGSIIPAALITGIRSDLPGQITAQITESVYDSPTGRILLVPQGTRLIGEYDSSVEFGQSRVLLVWTRMIFPNGSFIVLERQPGADSQGYAGLEDGVDYHWGELFKGAVLSTLLSIGAEAGSSTNDSDIVRALRQGASDSISQTGRQIVQRQLNIAPTLTIRPGFPVRVIVTRDLVLKPYGG